MADKNTNKEIEEIIEYFRNDIKWLEKELKNPHYLGYYITIQDKEYEYLKQLLDYITNLQKEMEILRSEYIEGKLKNDKAIEYIKSDDGIKLFNSISSRQQWYNYLLSILEGKEVKDE